MTSAVAYSDVTPAPLLNAQQSVTVAAPGQDVFSKYDGVSALAVAWLPSARQSIAGPVALPAPSIPLTFDPSAGLNCALSLGARVSQCFNRRKLRGLMLVFAPRMLTRCDSCALHEAVPEKSRLLYLGHNGSRFCIFCKKTPEYPSVSFPL